MASGTRRSRVRKRGAERAVGIDQRLRHDVDIEDYKSAAAANCRTFPVLAVEGSGEISEALAELLKCYRSAESERDRYATRR